MNNANKLSATEAALLASLTADTVTRLYSGKPGCCCGCLGKYTEKDSKGFRAAAARKLEALRASPDVEFFGNGFSIQTETRLNSVYLD